MSIAARRMQRVNAPAEWMPPAAETAGAVPLGTANYSIPGSNVIYLATNGNDTNPGTISAPKATLAAALGAASNGTTIIVRGGVYHEGEIEAGTKQNCIIQNYPGEAVWFDGAITLAGWVNNGNGTWSAPYTLTYDRQLGKGTGISVWSGAATRTIVDQVWLDSTKLSAVGDATTPGVGQFSVNQTTHMLTIGSSPSGKTAQVVDLKFLLAGSGIALKGIGVRRYVQAMVEWRGAAVCLGAGSLVEHCIIEQCSIDGLGIGGADSIVRHCTIQDTGKSGIMSDGLNNGILEHTIIRRCNRADFDAEPTTAGFKVGRSPSGLIVRFNHIEDVPDGQGIWFDTYTPRSVIYGNTVVGTSALGASYRMKNGIEIEGSDGGYFASVQYYNYVIGNRVTDCRQAGLLIFDSGWVKIWNNYLSSAVALYLWQDYRQNNGSKPSTEGTVQESPWHTTNIDIVNNIIVPAEIYKTQLRAQCNSDAAFKIAGGAMIERFAYNWCRPAGSGLFGYISNASGSTWATRQTLNALETLGSEFGGPLSSIMQGNIQQDAVPDLANGMPLPNDVASVYGVPQDISHIGPLLAELELMR